MTKAPRKPAGWEKELEDVGGATERDVYVAKPRVISEKKTNITFFLARSTHTRLKQLALERNTSLQQLVAEAVDNWLAGQSEPTFKAKDE